MPIYLLGGHEFNIDKEDVDQHAMHLEPGPLHGRNYLVVVGGKVFPIKQLLASVVNLPSEAFITMEAYKVLTELGYVVEYKR